MPYHLDHYALRTSGVFCEARCAGRPVLASKGSWAGDRVEREGGGWVVPEKNPAALAASIALAAGPDRQSKAQQAAALQEPSSREFSPDHFISNLIGLFGGGR
jgi:glycosyltransferase involved in cell wall biosynthesis